MKIGLIQIDGKMPNLALMKLARFHKNKGDDVKIIDLSSLNIDQWYGSKIFMGGSGYNLKETLPKDIDILVPDYEKFNIDYSVGFTTRGCFRNCGFCIVREKEGYMRECDMNWIKHSKAILWDNNFLASKKWKEKLQYFIDKNIKISFNQGLDLRLIDEEKAEMLSRVKYYDRIFHKRRIMFSFDDLKQKEAFIEKINILTKYILPSRIMICFIIGYDSTFENDMERFKIIRKLGLDPYAMPFTGVKKDRKKLDFYRWVNKRFYKSCEFKDFKPRK